MSLASDGWWNEVSPETARKARDWARRLLLAPWKTDRDMDLFIASLSPNKREDLIRRAVNGHGTANF